VVSEKLVIILQLLEEKEAERKKLLDVLLASVGDAKKREREPPQIHSYRRLQNDIDTALPPLKRRTGDLITNADSQQHWAINSLVPVHNVLFAVLHCLWRRRHPDLVTSLLCPRPSSKNSWHNERCDPLIHTHSHKKSIALNRSFLVVRERVESASVMSERAVNQGLPFTHQDVSPLHCAHTQPTRL